MRQCPGFAPVERHSDCDGSGVHQYREDGGNSMWQLDVLGAPESCEMWLARAKVERMLSVLSAYSGYLASKSGKGLNLVCVKPIGPRAR